MRLPDSDQTNPTFRHYFVDEAGDPSLFNKYGKSLIGKEGCSKFFILGLANVEEPLTIASELEKLRRRLLADSYFKGIPSFDPAQRKTARMFHAKDDLPEVRREVLLHPTETANFSITRIKKASGYRDLPKVSTRHGAEFCLLASTQYGISIKTIQVESPNLLFFASSRLYANPKYNHAKPQSRKAKAAAEEVPDHA